MFGNPISSFDRSLSLSIIYVLWKIKENLYCRSLILFNFSALASSNSTIIEAARCSLKSILEVEFNQEDDTGSNYLLNRPT